MMKSLIERVLQDGLKSIITNITRSSNLEQEQKDLLVIKSIGNLLSSAKDLQSRILSGDIWVLPGLLSFIDNKYKEQIEISLTGLFNLIKAIVVESNEENLENILIKVEKALILMKNDFVE